MAKLPPEGQGREELQRLVDHRREVRDDMTHARTNDEFDYLHTVHTSAQAQVTNLRRQLKTGRYMEPSKRMFRGVDLPSAEQAVADQAEAEAAVSGEPKRKR